MFGGAVLESLRELVFVVVCLELRRIHAALEENGVKNNVSYLFTR